MRSPSPRKCRDCGGNRKHFDGCEKFRPSPRKVGKALPLRVVRAALKADRDRLIRLVVDYTKKERANVDVGEPEMVKAWLAICRLASRLRRSIPRKAGARRGK